MSSGVRCSEILYSVPIYPLLFLIPSFSERLGWLQAYVLTSSSCGMHYFPVGFRAQRKSPPSSAVLGLVLHNWKLLGLWKYLE